MGIFVNKRTFQNEQNFGRKVVSLRKRKNDGQTTWIVQRNKKHCFFLKRTKKQKQKRFEIVLLEKHIFQKILKTVNSKQ